MTKATYTVDFNIGDEVFIDGDRDIKACVVAIEIRPGPRNVIRYECSWFHNGDVKFATFDSFRISARTE